MKKIINKLTGREKLLTISLIAVLCFAFLAAWGPPLIGAWRGFSKANSNNYQQLVVGPADTYTRGVYTFNRGTLTNVIEIENDGTATTAIDIDNDGTLTTGINLEGTITTDISLSQGDTIKNTAAGTVILSDDLAVDSIDAAGSGDTADFNGAFMYGTYTTAKDVDTTAIVADHMPLQVNIASTTNPLAGKNIIGAYLKAAATDADQANTTLYGMYSGADVDMNVAEAYGNFVQVTRDGDKDATAVYGQKIDVHFETGAAMTCDAYGLFAQIQGTNATTGDSIVGYFLSDVSTTATVEAETSAGKTVTDVLLLDNNGTATNGLFIDNDGTLATGIKIDGTVTNDIVLQNEETITNSPDGDITMNGDINAVNSGQIAGTWYVDDAAQNLTDQVMDTGGSATYNNTAEIVMPRAGSVIGIACFGNANVTTNDFQFDVTIDGTKTGLIATLDTTSLATHVNTQAKDADTFTAGQRIGIKWTSTAGALPTGTTDYTCTVLVEQ